MNHPNLKNPAVFPDLTLFFKSSNLPDDWFEYGYRLGSMLK